MILNRQTLATRPFIFAAFVIGFILLLGNSASVFACMCGKATTCERYNFSKTIFVGKALKVEKEDIGRFATESTIFEISEMLSGEKAKSIRVRNKSGFSCDVEFTIGETYLIFASGDKRDGFGTGFCSGNMPLQYASELISDLRKISGAIGDGRLIGRVLEESTKRSRDEERMPIQDIRILITQQPSGRKYNGLTDANGRYDVAVPPGKYIVTPVTPSNSSLTSLFEAEPMEVRSGGCAAGYFVLANDSVIAGRLINAQGKPAPYVRVELVAVDEKSSYLGGESDKSDANGYFSIKQVPVGKYTLSVNYNLNPNPEQPFPTTFYSSGGDRSKATVFEIGFGSRVEGLTWHLPSALVEKVMSGNVVLEDGSPVSGAEIKLFDLAFPGFYAGCYLLENRTKPEDPNSPVRSTSLSMSGSVCDLRSDANGEFRLTGYTGRTYRLTATISKTTDGQKLEYVGESEPFSLLNAPPIIKLILRKK